MSPSGFSFSTDRKQSSSCNSVFSCFKDYTTASKTLKYFILINKPTIKLYKKNFKKEILGFLFLSPIPNPWFKSF